MCITEQSTFFEMIIGKFPPIICPFINFWLTVLELCPPAITPTKISGLVTFFSGHFSQLDFWLENSSIFNVYKNADFKLFQLKVHPVLQQTFLVYEQRSNRSYFLLEQQFYYNVYFPFGMRKEVLVSYIKIKLKEVTFLAAICKIYDWQNLRLPNL